MCLDAHACDQLCKQFCKAPGLTYNLTNHKPGYFDECDYGLLYWTLTLLKLQFHQTHTSMVLSSPQFLHSLICGLLVTHCLVFILTNLQESTA